LPAVFSIPNKICFLSAADIYLISREIHEGLNVVENWNSANNFFYAGSGEFATNSRKDQETAMLSLYLRQISSVYINTLMIQQGFERTGMEGSITA
jgi:TnpA family transposase